VLEKLKGLLHSKTGVLGAVAAVIGLVIRLLDWWGRIDILRGIAGHWRGFLPSLTVFFLSTAGQWCIFGGGVLLIVWALVRSPAPPPEHGQQSYGVDRGDLALIALDAEIYKKADTGEILGLKSALKLRNLSHVLLRYQVKSIRVTANGQTAADPEHPQLRNRGGLIPPGLETYFRYELIRGVQLPIIDGTVDYVIVYGADRPGAQMYISKKGLVYQAAIEGGVTYTTLREEETLAPPMLLGVPERDEDEQDAALRREIADLQDGQSRLQERVDAGFLDIGRRLDAIVPLPSPDRTVAISGNQAEGFPGSVTTASPSARLLSPEAEASLKKELSRVHGTVGFTALQGDPRGIETMRELVDVFSQSGWTVRGMREATFRSPIEGLYIQASSAPAAYAGFVQSALQSVGIEAKGAIASLPQDEIEILLGATETSKVIK
jgi:hypothetical protein